MSLLESIIANLACSTGHYVPRRPDETEEGHYMPTPSEVYYRVQLPDGSTAFKATTRTDDAQACAGVFRSTNGWVIGGVWPDERRPHISNAYTLCKALRASNAEIQALAAQPEARPTISGAPVEKPTSGKLGSREVLARLASGERIEALRFASDGAAVEKSLLRRLRRKGLINERWELVK